VRGFYERHGHEPAWLSDDELHSEAERLVSALEASAAEGLHPEEYGATALRQRIEEFDEDSEARFALDVDLTRAFFAHASDLLHGRVPPQAMRAHWKTTRSADLPTVLDRALTETGVEEELSALRPAHKGYSSLRDALQRYREIHAAGRWPAVPGGERLEPGATDARRLAPLRQRLTREEFLPESNASGAPRLTVASARS